MVEAGSGKLQRDNLHAEHIGDGPGGARIGARPTSHPE